MKKAFVITAVIIAALAAFSGCGKESQSSVAETTESKIESTTEPTTAAVNPDEIFNSSAPSVESDVPETTYPLPTYPDGKTVVVDERTKLPPATYPDGSPVIVIPTNGIDTNDPNFPRSVYNP